MHTVRFTLALYPLLTGLVAQGWAPRTQSASLPGWRFAPFVHDAVRGRTVWFSGTVDQVPGAQTTALAEHWEFDGEAWARVQPRTMPPPRYLHAACYDSLRHRVLIFGGRSVPFVDRDDLWSWGGQAWTQLLPAASPPPRRSAALAYDGARDRVVLFGGVGSIYYDDTWEFDGTTWLQSAANGPTPRDQAAMAFDAARGVCVMTGGYNPGQGGLTTTWEYDGTAWTLRSNTSVYGPLVFDPRIGRVTGATSEWNGTGPGWVASAMPTPFPAWYANGLVFDPVRAAKFAFRWTVSAPATWETHVEQAAGWRSLIPPRPNAFLWDPVRQRMLAETDPATEWNGRELLPISPAAGTLGSVVPANVFDSARDEVVTLAGWTMLRRRGLDLQQLPSLTLPFNGGALAYDSVRNRYVVATKFQPMTFPPPPRVFQTWEYDGVSWQQIATATVPPAVTQPYALYDPVRQVVVMTGGFVGLFTPWNETWEYDGVDWRHVNTTAHPSHSPFIVRWARDSVRHLILTSSGSSTWAYDGTDWFVDSVANGPAPGVGAFDPVRNRIVGFGATGVYEYSMGPLPMVTSFGAGCSSSSPAMLELRASALPFLGASFGVRLFGLPPEHGLALLVAGFSDQSTGGTPLPLSLGTLGGPAGCSLFVDPLLVASAAHLGSTASFAIVLPNAPALAGTTFFVQGGAIDPLLALPLSVATSNALRCVSGL